MESKIGSERKKTALDGLRARLPVLRDSATAALQAGHDDVARAALRRWRLLLDEVASLSELISSSPRHKDLHGRIEAAECLLEASLAEADRRHGANRRSRRALADDPQLETDISELFASLDRMHRHVSGSFRGHSRLS